MATARFILGEKETTVNRCVETTLLSLRAHSLFSESLIPLHYGSCSAHTLCHHVQHILDLISPPRLASTLLAPRYRAAKEFAQLEQLRDWRHLVVEWLRSFESFPGLGKLFPFFLNNHHPFGLFTFSICTQQLPQILPRELCSALLAGIVCFF